MKKSLRIVLIILLFAMLIVIRGFIAPYFYDPLTNYFKNDYLYTNIPKIQFSTYLLHLFFRYILNAVVSLGIIFLFFQDKKTLVFAIKFYAISFIVLIIFLYALLNFNLSQGYILTFYVRRFLIQPLFVFILLPAFYYQKLKGTD
jgi:exosortase F-associated protein